MAVRAMSSGVRARPGLRTSYSLAPRLIQPPVVLMLLFSTATVMMVTTGRLRAGNTSTGRLAAVSPPYTRIMAAGARRIWRCAGGQEIVLFGTRQGSKTNAHV